MVEFDNLTELKTKVDQHRPLSPDIMEILDQKFKIEWTYNSNAIEGNTMTLQETAFFLQEGLTSKGKTLKDYLEIGYSDIVISKILKGFRHDCAVRKPLYLFGFRCESFRDQ